MPNPYLSNYALIGNQDPIQPALVMPSQQFNPNAQSTPQANMDSSTANQALASMLRAFSPTGANTGATQAPAPVFDATTRTVR